MVLLIEKWKVAERQGKYLANLLNKIGKEGGGRANSGQVIDLGEPFVYKHLGSMASVGSYKALVDLRQSKVIFYKLYTYIWFLYPVLLRAQLLVLSIYLVKFPP